MKKKIELTNQIRRFRFENSEMTQQELAERSGVTRQTIIALEAGKYSPSLLLAFRIARVFGVRVEDVFVYVDPADEGLDPAGGTTKSGQP
ncbi:MAG: helix-turn-helix transcriptional regulator [Sedimentisphaerales bacterium]|nr:helix-turn-helix transcriptional regulator [Sedimentisphaerales bacterium]